MKLFQKDKPVSPEEIIKELEQRYQGKTISPMVRKALIDFVNNEAENVSSLVLIWEANKQTFWKAYGMEPAQAILTMDQLHHRIQHEGLPDYD